MANVQSVQYSDPAQGQAPDWARFLSGMIQGGAGQITMQQKQQQEQDDFNRKAMLQLMMAHAQQNSAPLPGQDTSGDPFKVQYGAPVPQPLNDLQKAQMNHANSSAKLNQFKMDHPEAVNPFLNDLYKVSQINKNTQEKSEGLIPDFFKKKNPVNQQIEDMTSEMAKRLKTSPGGGYNVGDFVQKGGKTWKVTGFDPSDGHPLVDPAEGN